MCIRDRVGRDDWTDPAAPQQRPRDFRDAGDAMFPHVSRWSRGYDPDQVDTFFARARRAYEGHAETMGSAGVRTAAFDLVRGGYTPSAVDGALDRLEVALVRRERAAFVAEHGERAWAEHVDALSQTLRGRAARPAGLRFAPASGAGYAADEVDALVDRLSTEINDGGGAVTSSDIRSAVFRSARGHRAYAEGPVDAYLDRAVQVLLGLR